MCSTTRRSRLMYVRCDSPMLQVIYPKAFTGEWEVSARLQNVVFPFGQNYMNREVPGVTKASMVAALPDVGAGGESPVKFRCRFAASGNGAVPDRCVALCKDGLACAMRANHTVKPAHKAPLTFLARDGAVETGCAHQPKLAKDVAHPSFRSSSATRVFHQRRH